MTTKQKVKYYEKILRKNGLEEEIICENLPDMKDVNPTEIKLKIIGE